MSKEFLYHVTMERNWPSIAKKGLEPRVGDISEMLTHASLRPRVYFWTLLEDARWFKHAAKNFFVQSGLMRHEEELIILQVSSTELKSRGIEVIRRDVTYHNIGVTKHEAEVMQIIPPECVARVHE